MGLLNDAPGEVSGTGEGAKFIRLFESMDPEDQALIRKWDADPCITTNQIGDRIRAKFDVGRSTIERGLPILRSRWES